MLKVAGGGFVGQAPTMSVHASTSPTLTSGHVYNSDYKGPTYAVKYLGIVDGAMGILSRKMALAGQNQTSGGGGPPTATLSPLRAKQSLDTQRSVEASKFDPVL
jgi:hypothetical protein